MKMPIIHPGDNLLDIFQNTISSAHFELKEEDIIVIAETVVATSQNRIVNKRDVHTVSGRAKKIAADYDMEPKFVQLVLDEAEQILGGVHGVLLTEKYGVPIANAGIDESNAGGDGNYVLMPSKPYETARKYREKLMEAYGIKNLGLIITDSKVQPMKRGTVGVAFSVAGFKPIEKCQGKKDIFGRELKITERALADDLSSAAQILMGESDQRIPIVIIRNADVEFTDEEISADEMLIERNRCLFMNVFKKESRE